MEILWEDEIRKFEDTDRCHPPEKGRTLFIGSSILRMWDTRSHFPGIPHYNRCFGGARTWEVCHYYPRVVPHLAPSQVVYYCGSNDLCAGRDPNEVVSGFLSFLGLFRKDFPETRVLYLSILRSPAKKEMFEAVHSVNRSLSELAKTSPGLDYLDLNPALCDGSSDPRESYFVEDRNHLHETAYEKMSLLLRPTLSEP